MCKFSERLDFLMNERGLTNTALAEMTHTNKNTITSYRKDLRKPGLEILLELSDKLHVSLDWLCGTSDVMEIRLSEDVATFCPITRENCVRSRCVWWGDCANKTATGMRKT